MASTFVKSNRMMKRTESKKSHSWWWDSHISPKNSKWLQENLEEMDQYVKRMLKLIEEDADSFAKKAEMYYQKRPELINLVEEFYRMYRSLAERYDHVTGELRKNIPSDLQSQCSGISDIGSEPPSTMPSPDRRPSRRKSGRAAGFDFFLGGGTELYNKEGDESSTLDSESESDDSSVHNYSGVQNDEEEQGLRQKIIELEVELRQVKEKLQVQEEPINESYFKKGGDENCEAHDKVIAKYEEELQVTKEKLRVSEEEISRLTVELQTYESLVESSASMEQNRVRELQESFDGPELVHKIQSLEEELSIMQEKLRESEEEVMSLRQEITIKESTIENLQDELSAWRNNLGRETGEVAKLQDHVERYKMNLLEREQEIQELKEAMSNSHKSLSEENKQLKAEISQLSKERTYLDDNLKELDLSRQSLEEDLRLAKAGEAETEELKTALSALQQKYNILTAEKDDLNANISALSAEVNSKDDQIDQMSHHLQQLHMEHVNLIAAAEVARKSAVELRLRIKELEREVEKKQQIIVEGAEEKREAIRQLCFSLEHYRNGYHRLREVVVGNKGTPVMAT